MRLRKCEDLSELCLLAYETIDRVLLMDPHPLCNCVHCDSLNYFIYKTQNDIPCKHHLLKCLIMFLKCLHNIFISLALICLYLFVSHLLIAGCDIGVRIFVIRPSVRQTLSQLISQNL